MDSLRSHAYSFICERLDAEFLAIDREKVTPWASLAKTHGVTLSGSARYTFWNSFIQPILTDLISRAFAETRIFCDEHEIDRREPLKETAARLQSGIHRTFDRMVQIERRARGRGFPKGVPPYNPERHVTDVEKFLDERLAAEIRLIPSPLPATSTRDLMKRELGLVKLTVCGPGDVATELGIAREEIEEWNRLHGEAARLMVKHQHWSTDSYPDLSDRPQEVINKRLIDGADILVAIFWSRFGTPTGIADSGTEEEIRRGVTLGKKVMVYFSDLEPLPRNAQAAQLTRLEAFRNELRPQGLCWSFQSRSKFREHFRGHLAMVLNEIRQQPEEATTYADLLQDVSGNHNVVAGRDVNYFQKPPVQKPVMERRADSVSRAEAKQIQDWIAELADGTVGKSRRTAFGEWQTRFKKRFGVARYDELESSRVGEAQAWYREQKAIQTRGLKRKSPDDWSRQRKGSIKAAMAQMGKTNEDYYQELSRRLKMKDEFTSLSDLTKRDLDRVYNMVRRDSNG